MKKTVLFIFIIFFSTACLLFGYSRILIENRVFVPSDYKLQGVQKKAKLFENFIVDLYSRGFAQGDAIYIEIRKVREKGNVSLLGISRKIKKRRRIIQRRIYFRECSWGYRAFMAIDPEETAGIKKLMLKCECEGKTVNYNMKFTVKKTSFFYSRKPLDLGKYSDLDFSETPENKAFIKRCHEKKKKIFRHRDSDRIKSRLSHPRNMHFITSPFWAKRTYMKYRIVKGRKKRYRNKIGIHRGVDLRGVTGESVFSMAAGRVAIAEEMFYEGNFIVIDHGNKIFSYYMHLDSMNVKEGDIIKAGERIAKVGTSGVSTAAHLHVSFMIRGVQVDPMSILPLPLKN